MKKLFCTDKAHACLSLTDFDDIADFYADFNEIKRPRNSIKGGGYVRPLEERKEPNFKGIERPK